MVSASDSQPLGPRFEDSDHYLDLFHSSPKLNVFAMLINSQWICLQPIGILNYVIFNLNHLFELFAQPHGLCATCINTAKGK